MTIYVNCASVLFYLGVPATKRTNR